MAPGPVRSPTAARTPPSARTSACSAGCSARSCATRPATTCSSSSRRSAGAPSTPGATAAARSARCARRSPGRSIDDQLHLIRAFGWLPLLANTAEDVHHERRRRYHRHARLAAAGRQPRGDARPPRRRRRRRRDDRSRLIDDLLVVPVITAHPTEVRRQTVLDVLGDVARLLAARTDGRRRLGRAARHRPPARRCTCSRCGRRPCCGCRSCASPTRSTRRCATTRPACSRSSRRSSATSSTSSASGGAVDVDATDAVRMGSWIGGDRDGNPFVTADVLRTATDRQAAHRARPPPRRPCAGCRSSCRCRPACHADRRAAGAGRRVRRRLAVPRRRAVPAGAARDVRPAVRAGRRRARPAPPPTSRCRRPPVPGPPYDVGRRARRRPRRRRRRRCAPHGAARARRRRSSSRCAAPSSRSAPTCAGSTCARTPTVHEQVVAELLAVAGVVRRLPRARRGRRGSPCSRAELRSPRPLRSPFADVQRARRPASSTCSRRRPTPSPASGRRPSRTT